MTKKPALNLSDEDFYALAVKQSAMYPDLLLLRSEFGIIQDFYEYYGRKLPKEKLWASAKSEEMEPEPPKAA